MLDILQKPLLKKQKIDHDEILLSSSVIDSKLMKQSVSYMQESDNSLDPGRGEQGVQFVV